MCPFPYIQTVQMLTKPVMLQRQGNPNLAVVSTEMRKHISVRRLHFLAEGYRIKADSKSNFLGLW